MAFIKDVWAREILDSRSIPTIECAVRVDSGYISVSSVPTGASTGSLEAMELRDQDELRYFGRGVLKAVENVNKIIGPAIKGMDPSNQVEIDKKIKSLDGTENKSKLGANSLLAVSMATSKIGATVNGVNLYSWINMIYQKLGAKVSLRMPTPLFNMINGGLHGSGNLDFQEFHLIPSSSKTFSQGLQLGSEIYVTIGKNLARRGAIHSIGDEGGYAPNLFTNADALEILVESIKETTYNLGRDVLLGLDVAASSFYTNGVYQIRDKTTSLDNNSMIEYYKSVNDQYHLAIIEDPLHEEAWDAWQKFTAAFGNQMVVVGDDLLVTNPKRLERAIKDKACNAILIKPNQIGTVTETLNVVKMAQNAGMKVNVSHRSGETNDWFIADFAVGVGADYVKFGAPARGERVAKYNRLLSIEGEIYPQ